MASNWDDLERWMEGQQLPRGFEVLREPDWVEKFVRRMMTKALPDVAGHMTGTKAAQTTESKLYIGVKFKLPPGCDKDLLRLRVKEDALRIDGLPGGKHEIIKLPKLVKPRICQAAVKGGTLHVKLRKRPMSRTYHEHSIYWP
ncbi:Hsp20/alpha crystallin family protein [Paenibacillus sp. NPDC057967]|uniref:Hsp20/alpha crystallin family protein n=1 Tax=Paenibacillus sp. NPDC057967 TaxID=3346293 RepID=UPI0036DB8E90